MLNFPWTKIILGLLENLWFNPEDARLDFEDVRFDFNFFLH